MITNLAERRIPTQCPAPSPHMMARCQALGRQIVAAVDDRVRIVNERGLDPAFCLPAANWAQDAANDYMGAYRILAELDSREIGQLRLRAQPYSGLYMMGLPLDRDYRAVEPAPDIDALLPDQPPEAMLARWHELTDGLPERHLFKAPHIAGEAGWWVDGGVFNGDTLPYQERLSLLSKAGVFDRLNEAPRILEIGGGYGALARAMTEIIPSARYTICDLPESLLFSGLYLTLAGRQVALNAEAPVRLIPNFLFGDLAGERFDLVINTLSMSEMSPHQVRTYCRGIAELIGDSGVFFEQNQDNRYMGFECAWEIAASVFPHKRQISGVSCHEGLPHLWANQPSAVAR